MKKYSLPEIEMEDAFTDVLGKAFRGQNFDLKKLALDNDLPLESLQQLLKGKLEIGSLEKIAPALGLNTKSLIALAKKNYKPKPIKPFGGFAHFSTPFGDMMVNSYLIWNQETKLAAAFDTGSDVSDMLDIINGENLNLESVFITHAHGDHIFDLERLLEKTKAQAYAGKGEDVFGAKSFSSGREFKISNLKIETRLTSGHSIGGISYIVSGLEHQLAFVGDALFAGSMGGGNISYQQALECNARELFTLPDTTIICPGHGPLTTLGEEKHNNPFYTISL
ncbi:MAG: MBL fold metallo-hydrolase [Chthoniobacterales bacterium]